MRKKIIIVGGGSSAHAIIPLLSMSDLDVSILTSRPADWSHTIVLEHQDTNGEIIQKYEGHLVNICDKPEVCIPQADYIILCMPVHKYRVSLHNIAPYVNREKEVVIGTVYGQGGFNWMVEEIQQKYNLSNLIYFAFGLIPWICRTKQYGKIGVTYGFKMRNAAAVYPHEHFQKINEELFQFLCNRKLGIGAVEQLSNFISITLSVDNQIIHPTRCYGINHINGSSWQKVEDVPLFYKDYDGFSAQCLESLDDDYSKIRNQIKVRYPQKDFHYMLNYLDLEHYTYNSSSVDIVDSFVNSPTLQRIKTPVVVNDLGEVEIDKNCRFFMDDIYYGVAITKWIAELFRIDTPMIDKILHWAQRIRNEKIISNENKLILNSIDLCAPMKSGVPFYYGKTTVEEIVD